MKQTISLLLALALCLSLCACGGGSGTPETTEATEAINMVSMGEKLTGGNMEITVKGIEFAELLGKDNTTRVFERDVSWDNPGEGKVYAIIKFDYTNLAKQEVDMVRDVKITIVYKDGSFFQM